MNFSNTSLFVGDLPKFCSEQDLESLFQAFGPVLDAKIKRNVNTGKTLSYGFVTLTSEAAAAEALKALDGAMFSGRKLRVRWAMYNAKSQTPTNSGIINSVYIRFVTPRTDRLVTEEDLHNVFDTFGSVLDVSIKESSVDPRTGRQSGYGFVHFACDQSGVEAAFQAVAALDNAIIDGITYNVELSKNLLKQFGERQNAEAAAAAGGALPPPPIDVNQSNGFVRIPSQNAMPSPSPRNNPNGVMVPPPIVIPGGNGMPTQAPSPKWANHSPNNQMNNNFLNRNSPYNRSGNQLTSPNMNPALMQQSRVLSSNATPVHHSQSNPDFYATMNTPGNGLPRTLSNSNNRGSIASPNANQLHRISSFGAPGSGTNTPGSNTPNLNAMRPLGTRSGSNNNMNGSSTSLLYTLNNNMNPNTPQEYYDPNANAAYLRNASFRSDPGSYNNGNNRGGYPNGNVNSPGQVMKSVNSLHSIPSNHSIGNNSNGERHVLQSNTSQYSIMSNSSYHSVHSEHSLFNMSESYDPQSYHPQQQLTMRGNSNNALYGTGGMNPAMTNQNPILSVKSTDSDESDTYEENEQVLVLQNTNKDDFFAFITTSSGKLQPANNNNNNHGGHNTSGHSFYSNGSNSSQGTSPGQSSNNVLSGLLPNNGSAHNLHATQSNNGIAMTASASADYTMLQNANVPQIPVNQHVHNWSNNPALSTSGHDLNAYYQQEINGGSGYAPQPQGYNIPSANSSPVKNSPIKSNSFLLQQQQQHAQILQHQYAYPNEPIPAMNLPQQQATYQNNYFFDTIIDPNTSLHAQQQQQQQYHPHPTQSIFESNFALDSITTALDEIH